MTGLPPRIHPDVDAFLADGDAVAELLSEVGSPLNVVFPDLLRENVTAFRRVLTEHGLRHRICFAHKANQSRLLVAAAAAEGIAVDVASPGEWANARAAGVEVGDLIVTGPKGPAFLEFLVSAGAVVIVDNPWELDQLIRLVRRRVLPAGTDASGGEARVRILVRISGFAARGPHATPTRVSRFGIPVDAVDALLEAVHAAREVIDLLGVAFHVDSNAVSDKVTAIDTCLEIVERAWHRGLSPRVLDLGGGFGQVHLENPQAYEDYSLAVRRGLIGAGPPMTWDGNQFGYRIEPGGAVTGTPTFHRYANAVPGPRFLADILTASLPGHHGRTVSEVLRDNLIEVWIEPGRALVDQAGVTLTTVQFTTIAADGSRLVHLDLSRDKICPADQEVLVDPLVIPRTTGTGRTGSAPVGVFFAGCLCLERDMVYQHLTLLDRLPEPGDIIAFVNTAAYQMDLSASEALLHPRPARVGVFREGNRFVSRSESTPAEVA